MCGGVRTLMGSFAFCLCCLLMRTPQATNVLDLLRGGGGGGGERKTQSGWSLCVSQSPDHVAPPPLPSPPTLFRLYLLLEKGVAVVVDLLLVVVCVQRSIFLCCCCCWFSSLRFFCDPVKILPRVGSLFVCLLFVLICLIYCHFLLCCGCFGRVCPWVLSLSHSSPALSASARHARGIAREAVWQWGGVGSGSGGVG